MAKLQQKEVDKRLTQEHNMMFMKRAQDEVNKEIQYKEHFIRHNDKQMKRGQALLSNIYKKHGHTVTDNIDDKLIRVRQLNRSVQLPHNTSVGDIKGGIKYIDVLNNEYQNMQKHNIEDDSKNIEHLRQTQYKDALDEQLRQKRNNEIFDPLNITRTQPFRSNKNGQGMAMIPGINSSSSLIQKEKDKISAAPYNYQNITRNSKL